MSPKTLLFTETANLAIPSCWITLAVRQSAINASPTIDVFNLHPLRRLILTLPFSVALATSCVSPAAGEVIFESGMLGPTGQNLGEVDFTAIRSNTFNGVRFEFAMPVRISQVGGHFADAVGWTFFGALVALDNENDFPDSGDLSTDDVLGVAELTFPVPSDEVLGDVDVRLEPRWYALVFGSGLFGTSGQGGAIRHNLDVGEYSYIGWQPGANLG